MKFTTLAATAALALAPMAASAIPISVTPNPTITSANANAPAGVTVTTTDYVEMGVTGSRLITTGIGTNCIPGISCRRDPFEGTAFAGSGAYNSVQGGSPASDGPGPVLPGGSVTYTWNAGPVTAGGLSLLWGSPDTQDAPSTWNFLTFYLNANQVGQVNGSQVVAAAQAIDATFTAGLGAVLVTAFVPEFDKVVFTTSATGLNDAFEYSNVQVIPLPAALILFGTAFAGAGLVRRYGRKPIAA